MHLPGARASLAALGHGRRRRSSTSAATGGFKLGVDLVGGTILVYEIDLRKQQDDDKDTLRPDRDINVLAESLKRRIDPNDLYNIIIRPAGGEGRVEIILPTGGTHRTKKAEQAWNDLLEDMENDYEAAARIASSKSAAARSWSWPTASRSCKSEDDLGEQAVQRAPTPGTACKKNAYDALGRAGSPI